MRFASETSCSAVSSGTRPISRRYSRSASRLGSTVRSISGVFVSAAGVATRLPRHRPADAVLEQVGVEILDLLLGELDLVDHGGHLVVRHVPAFETDLDEPLQLLDLGQLDIDCQHRLPLTRYTAPSPGMPNVASHGYVQYLLRRRIMVDLVLIATPAASEF